MNDAELSKVIESEQEWRKFVVGKVLDIEKEMVSIKIEMVNLATIPRVEKIEKDIVKMNGWHKITRYVGIVCLGLMVAWIRTQMK